MKTILLIALLFLTACENKRADEPKCLSVFTHELGAMQCLGNSGTLSCSNAGCFAKDCTSLMLGLKHVDLRLDGNVIYLEKDTCDQIE